MSRSGFGESCPPRRTSREIGSEFDAGFASRCAKLGDCERAESALDSYQQGSGATGRYQLHFKGGRDLHRAFYVKWRESHLLCG